MIEKKLEDKKNRVPERIEVDFPYVVLADFEHVFGRFEGLLGDQKVDEFEKKVALVLAKASPDLTNMVSLKIKKITDEVESRIAKERSTGSKVGVVQLDRYINGDDKGDYFRLEVSRGVSGGLVPRPGCDVEVDDQFRALAEWVVKGNYDELLIVDDVLAFGDTLTPMLNGFKELIPETKLKVLVGLAASGGGWQGLERVTEETGVEVEAVTIVKAGEENEWTSGMAMPALRDFTFLGGKISVDEVTGKRQNFPYFLPFSVPVISFMPKERRYDAAVEMLNISIEVVEEMRRNLGRDLVMKDLQDAGFGLPSVKLECLQDLKWVPSEEDSVWEYLQYNKHLLENFEEEIREEALR
ncbi:hypothetical protein A2572_02290 [Candidatus Collierbacteria bacterium RIFOXYD1_FULL_40_9]|uniref:Uncharacterized protein n=1 Tax=Candidatus Collierbacteria bacterium RIFOXYD1_FULL_40_9 TaxID=1817731 RepID=A0A1F5FNW6_9BACT|nr:MAG: hypothetical protein A2572_02290 [Candidatus Collierbacteria bacterium RIFOXYD1_FULL_40_9]